jgi:hypothetical protein
MKTRHQVLKYHSYPKEIANQYDITIALLLEHFTFWYEKVKSEDHQFFDGDYWVRMKLETLHKYFSYLTIGQLRHILRKMVSENLIKKSEFNYKANNRTKWYTLTKKSKKLMLVSDKKVTEKSDTQSVENYGPIYKEEDIENRYIYIFEKLITNESLIELLAMQNKLSKQTVKTQIKVFAIFCQSISQPKHNNDKDLFTHFGSWLRKQDLKEFKYDRDIKWFIDKFNEISRREFIITDTIRDLFARQRANGFDGRQMLKAVENLYSSDVKNQFHIKHNFKFATPEYLLKDGNLNKYLNLKY